ncbi:formyl transferase [Natronomonas sp. CBA1123]|uniref:methionyl-tRNA formyltransferase n=1 Tax=Natronomonas sp. CBA1123 TaxID=2668070 RepID=UPI0012EAA2B9|nr:formyltransferase family protein [Natronomonas sp. CBA1123]MUV85128.1 formyl transferase [Natronomonas sp. CBA1123]
MTHDCDVIFLGINDAGMRVYEWLCEQDDIFVHSLLTTREQLSVVESVKPDYLVSCGYRHIVPEEVLSIPSEGCLNLHPAYLPYNRGANPNVWSIVDGTPAGVTLHYMDPGIDTGNIIARRTVETDFSDTGKDLYERLGDAQVELFQDVWPDIVEKNVDVIEQDADAGTYHETSDFKDLCHLDPHEEVKVKELLNRLRALTFPPYDNAEIEIDGDTYYIEIDIERA